MFKKIILLIVLPVILGVCAVRWFWIAFDYDDSALTGRYSYSHESTACTVDIFPNFRYRESILVEGKRVESEGVWDRAGESGIIFVTGFQQLPGQTKMSSGGSYGYFHRRWNLMMELTLQGNPGNFIFSKKLSPSFYGL